MSYWERKNARKDSFKKRMEAKNILMNYFFDLFQGKYKFQNVEYQEQDFILNQAWFKGSLACKKLDFVDEPVFVAFVGQHYNRNNYPIDIKLLPVKRDVAIPLTNQKVGEDAEIVYFQKSRTPLRDFVEYHVEKMVDIEMLKDSNVLHLKNPYMIAVTPEDKQRLKNIIDRIENDEDVIFCDLQDIQAVKTLVNTSPYILDKLEEYEKAQQNKILTFLGINNVDNEKKEHLIVDEVNANNDFIASNSDNFVDITQSFFDRCNKLFGLNMKIEVKEIEKPIKPEQKKEKEEEQNDL